MNIKRWVFIGPLRCLKWHRYDLRGCLQILSGVMKLYCHALAEVGLRGPGRSATVALTVWFVRFGDQETCRHTNDCISAVEMHSLVWNPLNPFVPLSSLCTLLSLTLTISLPK